jgi:hypothetical protein
LCLLFFSDSRAVEEGDGSTAAGEPALHDFLETCRSAVGM